MDSDFSVARPAYNNAYFSTGNCSYALNTHAAHGMPLAFGIIRTPSLIVPYGGYVAPRPNFHDRVSPYRSTEVAESVQHVSDGMVGKVPSSDQIQLSLLRTAQ